ncbi:FecCD family ABC transporter permease [Gordonia insulae]|uniref:Ferric enterobactin transport system permease protein FepG n=1 Tax=Gordonia insulae TaxID=2420509 RepID=A0A3G8JIX3_9ACTN|nr:iron chelate uptake ABC transporter family permease subunit [Gordonia insulae]AZG45036.1 Ferric enterobactin transport system permease protein FepG [Gordonia insulae]
MNETAIDFGRSVLVVRGPGGAPSLRIGVRSSVVVLLLICVASLITVLSLGTGDFHVPPLRVLDTLFGGGNRLENLVITEWRMPRVASALVLGAALGVSGAVFQSLTRNPLGSPDIIGFNTGAYTGALVVMLLIGGDHRYGTAAGALLGGVCTALAVYVIAFTRGVQGFRLIVVGIGVSAMLASLNTWLILKADLDDALSAATWGAGSLNGITWADATPALIVTVVLVPFVMVAAYLGPVLEMGDDTARAFGLRVEPTRLFVIVLGVALTAVATAVAGPIAFVALAAPQLARRLTRSAGVALAPAAAMGAVLLVGSDYIAQHAFAPTQLPVGVVTASIGGVYLVWLLAQEARRQ